MPDSREAAEFRISREALRRRRQQGVPVRKLAVETGLKKSTVNNIIKGITKNPSPPTRRKLVEWHVGMLRKGYEAGTDKEPTEETKLIAILYLVQDYSIAEQKEFARDLYEKLREYYTNTGARAPKWLPRLKKLIDVEWP